MAGKSMKLGGGGRFQKLKRKVESEGHSPSYAAGVAAKVGMEKYGKKKMEKMAKTGKARAERKSEAHTVAYKESKRKTGKEPKLL